jgi:hypothetical protein
MTAYAVLILAIAMFTGLPVVPVVPASAGMSLPSKTVVFSEVIRSVPLNFSTLILVEEEETEAFAVVPTPVATRNAASVAIPVAVPVDAPGALEEEEDAALPFLPTKNATATGGPSTYYDLLHESFEFASSLWEDASPRLQESYDRALNLWEDASPRLQESYDRASNLWEDASPRLQESYDRASSLSYDLVSSLWEDASHAIAYSNEKVSNKNGPAIQVSKISLHIFSARFTVMFESGIVKASVVSLSPEITRILSKQSSLTSPSQPTCNVDAMDVLTSKAMTFSKQCPLTPPSQPTCNVDAMDVLTSKAMLFSKQCPLTPPSQPTCNVDAMDVLHSITMILSKQCPLTPPIKTTCDAIEELSPEELALISCLVLIVYVLGLRLRPTVCAFMYGIRRVCRTFSSAVIFMYRALPWTFPIERIMYEVEELCLCKLMHEHHYWTGEIPKGEITDEVKKGMIRRVGVGRYKAYRQGKWEEPTMSDCLRTCCTEVSSSFTAEVHHFHHSSPDEKLRRDIGEKCYCVLKEEYIQLTGNKIFEEDAALSALRSAVFQAHKKKSAHRFCSFGRGR